MKNILEKRLIKEVVKALFKEIMLEILAIMHQIFESVMIFLKAIHLFSMNRIKFKFLTNKYPIIIQIKVRKTEVIEIFPKIVNLIKKIEVINLVKIKILLTQA